MNKGHEQEELREREERPTNLVVEASKRLIARIESIIRRMLEELNLKGKQAQDWLEDNWQTYGLPIAQNIGKGATVLTLAAMLTFAPATMTSCAIKPSVVSYIDENGEEQILVDFNSEEYKQWKEGYNEYQKTNPNQNSNRGSEEYNITLKKYYQDHDIGFSDAEIAYNTHIYAMAYDENNNVYIFSRALTSGSQSPLADLFDMVIYPCNYYSAHCYENVDDDIINVLFNGKDSERLYLINKMEQNMESINFGGFCGPGSYYLLRNSKIFENVFEQKNSMAIAPRCYESYTEWWVLGYDEKGKDINLYVLNAPLLESEKEMQELRGGTIYADRRVIDNQFTLNNTIKIKGWKTFSNIDYAFSYESPNNEKGLTQ